MKLEMIKFAEPVSMGSELVTHARSQLFDIELVNDFVVIRHKREKTVGVSHASNAVSMTPSGSFEDVIEQLGKEPKPNRK